MSRLHILRVGCIAADILPPRRTAFDPGEYSGGLRIVLSHNGDTQKPVAGEQRADGFVFQNSIDRIFKVLIFHIQQLR